MITIQSKTPQTIISPNAFTLASKGVVTREDLAELATDDLLEISEMDEEVAAALIMKARAHWFEEEQQA